MKNEFSFFTRPLTDYQRLPHHLCSLIYYKGWGVFIIHMIFIS